MKNFKKCCKKINILIMVLGVMITSMGLPPYMKVVAGTTKLELKSQNTISIDTTDTKKLLYKIDDVLVGTVKVKKDGEYLTPVMSGDNATFDLPEYDGETFNVVAEVRPESGYDRQLSYFFGSPIDYGDGPTDTFPGDNNVGFDITSASTFTFDFKFEESNGSGDGGNSQSYPIVGYFEGVANGVLQDSQNNIVMPNGWTNGDVTFKAKICTNGEGVVSPNNGQGDCGTASEIPVAIEGLVNGRDLNDSVSGINIPDVDFLKAGLVISEAFSNYKKATMHIVKRYETDPEIFSVTSVVTKDMIDIRAVSNLSLSLGLGSDTVNQAVITNNVKKDLSIFFGNTSTKLVVSGPNVDKITKINNNESNITLNDDGSANVTLPELSKETTTPLEVSILLKDGSTIKRSVDIKRTALMLEHDDEENKVKIGYVLNKKYLYDEQVHNDDVFDARIQVILYKGNSVAGFKQFEVDDEEIINALVNETEYNGMILPPDSWGIESLNSNMVIDLDEYEGVDRVGVFLTNGEINGDSETLPSIEYGVGAGLSLSWEVE